MSTRDDWSEAYARQADADLKAWDAVQAMAGVAECHRLQLLQMACEKLCKAYLIAGGTDPTTLQSSHGYIANPLPIVISQQIVFMGQSLRKMGAVLTYTRHLAREIELLCPACHANAQRPDNCEYPWEDSVGTVRSPLDQAFHPSKLGTSGPGRTIIKLVRGAINRLMP